MTRRTLSAVLVLFLLPALAGAQGFRDLDTAVSGIARGFERGEGAAIVAGMGSDDQVMLQFPGLVDASGFFGRDQASYVLEELFGAVKPGKFRQVSARKVSSAGQYHITARWTVERRGKSQDLDVYIKLTNRNDRWSVVSIRSGS